MHREAPVGEAVGRVRQGDRLLVFGRSQVRWFGRVEVVYLRNVPAYLRQDCSGSSLIEYSFLIGVGVVLAGRWAVNMWTSLGVALPPQHAGAVIARMSR